MGELNYNSLHGIGIKQAVAKVLNTIDDYNNIFNENVKDEILDGLPDFLKEQMNPELLTMMVSFSILYMFLPENKYKDRFDKVTLNNVEKFIRQSGDKDKPRISIPKEFQPYILRDLPRKVKENLPVPNWTKNKVYPTFKTVPADKQGEIKNIISDSIKKGENVDVLTKRIVDKIGIKESFAERIADTEIRRARHWAYCQIGKQLGYTKHIFRSYFGRCKICQALDGKIFPIETQVIPDMTHPHCNCSTFIIPSSKKE